MNDDIDLWEIDELGATPVTADTSDSTAEGPSYAHLGEFVEQYLAPLLRRRLNGSARTWCPRWWEHEEAISRLDAMWRAWEHLRQDPLLGMSTWWLYHCDPHMAVLCDADNGPFSACSPKNGHAQRPFDPLPMEPPPDDLWAGTPFEAKP